MATEDNRVQTTITTQAELDFINKAKAGDKTAFAALIQSHYEGIVHIIYRLCGDGSLAEDAAQETFIRAWQALPTYQPRAPFKNWLYRIAVNSARDMLRRERPNVDIEAVPLSSSDPRPEAEIIERERDRFVQKAVLTLPPASQSVLVLREYGGFSYREIANTLNIPIGTVMSRLSYARNRLRELLAPYMEIK